MGFPTSGVRDSAAIRGARFSREHARMPGGAVTGICARAATSRPPFDVVATRTADRHQVVTARVSRKASRP
jgi:hypothetical protein